MAGLRNIKGISLKLHLNSKHDSTKKAVWQEDSGFFPWIYKKLANFLDHIDMWAMFIIIDFALRLIAIASIETFFV